MVVFLFGFCCCFLFFVVLSLLFFFVVFFFSVFFVVWVFCCCFGVCWGFFCFFWGEGFGFCLVLQMESLKNMLLVSSYILSCDFENVFFIFYSGHDIASFYERRFMEVNTSTTAAGER